MKKVIIIIYFLFYLTRVFSQGNTTVITIGTPAVASGGSSTTISGNAGSATSLNITNDNSTNATMYPVWSPSITGNQTIKTSSTGLRFNPSTQSYLFGNKGLDPDSRFIGEFIKDQNTNTQVVISNNSTGDNALARIVLNNSSDFLDNDITGAHYGQVAFCGRNSTFGGNFPFWGNKMIVASGGNGDGLVINADAGAIDFTVRRNTGNFNEDFNTSSIYIKGGSSAVSGNSSVTGNVGIRNATPTAKLHLGIGTATANTAPLKFTSQGTAFLTVPEAGVIEYGTPGFVIQNDKVVIGAKAPISAENVSIQSTANTSTYLQLTNSSSGTGAITFTRTQNNNGKVTDFGTIGTGYTTIGAFQAGYGYGYSSGTGLNIINDNASGSINYYVGGFGSGNKTVTMGSSSAWLQPSAGTAAIAPFKLTTSGTTFLSTPTAGALEFGTVGIVSQADAWLWGGTSLIAGEKLSVQTTANTAHQIMLYNSSSGNAALSLYQSRNNNGKFSYFGMVGQNYTTDGGFIGNYNTIYTSGLGNNIMAGDASGSNNFYTGGYSAANLRMTIHPAGQLTYGTSAISESVCDVFGNGCVTANLVENHVKNQNDVSRWFFGNNSSGTSARAALAITGDLAHGEYGSLQLVPTTNTTAQLKPGIFLIGSGSGATNGLEIYADNGIIAMGTVNNLANGSDGLVVGVQPTQCIGIGTRTPSSLWKLDIVGSSRASIWQAVQTGTTSIGRWGRPGASGALVNDYLTMSINGYYSGTGLAITHDDATLPYWAFDFDPRAGADVCRIRRAPIGASTDLSNLWLLSSTGVTTSAGTTYSNTAINTTAGDAATINGSAGRFRKDQTGNTFTLTNSFITANSIIKLEFASDLTATGNAVSVAAGSGSAVVTFWTVGLGAAPPGADTYINFIIVN